VGCGLWTVVRQQNLAAPRLQEAGGGLPLVGSLLCYVTIPLLRDHSLWVLWICIELLLLRAPWLLAAAAVVC
jgi:hypothetical protein